MAMSWFHPKARIMIITLLNVVNTLSLVVSAQLPGKLFKNYHLAADTTDYEDGREKFSKLVWLEFFISLSIAPCILLLKSRPAEIPVKIHKVEKKRGMMRIMLRLFKNRNFVLLFIPFSLFFGILKAVLVEMELLMKPYGYSVETVAGVGKFNRLTSFSSTFWWPYSARRFSILY